MTGRRATMMNRLVTRRIMVGEQALELWDNPDGSFEATHQALAYYASVGAWIASFDGLALRFATLRPQ
jgi:hypothetical protein